MHTNTDFVSNLLFIKNEGVSPQQTPGDALRTQRSEPSLADSFCEIATLRAEQPALSNADLTVSYFDILSAAKQIAAQLKSYSHYQPGDRVILLVPNSVAYVPAFYGILMAQGVVVPLPANTESGTLQKILKSTAASYLITTPPVLNRQPDPQDFLSEPFRIVNELPKDNDAAIRSSSVKTGHDLAAIFFTAGSSGTPKGVMLSHTNLISNARSIGDYLKLKADERPLCILPFHHAFGNSVLQSHILIGSHLILDGNTTFPESIIESLIRHQCTSLAAVPDLFRILLERTSLRQSEISTLRYMSVAGGALPHQLSVEISQCIAPARFYVMYGQTEATARLAYVPPEHLTGLSDGCIGRAIPGVTLEVVDDNGRAVEPGEVGELRAKGANIMQGYWQDPAGSQERLRNDWLYTGDLATIDEAGWFIIKGRQNSLVKISGYRVHPADLEEFALRSFPIAQAVAVPFESKHIGTRLFLYVKPTSADSQLPVTEMIGMCRDHLPRQLVPDRIQMIENFPLNHALKIDRLHLSRLAEQAGKKEEKQIQKTDSKV